MKPELDPSRRDNKIPQQKEKGKCRWCQSDVPKGRRSWCSDACVEEALIRTSSAHARRRVEERDKGVCACCSTDTREIENTFRRLANMAHAGLTAYDRTQNKAARRYAVERPRLTKILAATSTDFEAAAQEARILERPEEYRHRLQSPWTRRWDGWPLAVTVPEQRIRTVNRRLMKLAAARLKSFAEDLIARGFDGVTYGHGAAWISRSLWDADHIVPVIKGGGGCGLENYRTLCQPCHKKETARLAAVRALERRGIDPKSPDPQGNLF